MAIELARDNARPIIEHDWQGDLPPVAPPAAMAVPPLHIGGLIVSASHDPCKVWIHRANGEGGQFSRAALTEHMARALDQFYAENF